MISEDAVKAINSATYTFGEFRLEAENLLLLRDSEVVPLTPKAVEVLLTLIESNGKLITKQEILDKVWRDTFVEEANLTHHISALRKALGEDKNGRKFIETIPRRGYRFIAEVKNAAIPESAEIVISERITASLREEIEIETGIEPSVEQITRVSDFRKNESAQSRFVKIAVTSACILLAVFVGLAVYQFMKLRRESNTPNGNLAPISYTRLIDNKSIGGTVISPDGKFAAYFQNYFNGEGGTIFLRQLETNREVALLEPADRIFGNMDFSPDGSQLFYVSFEKDSKIGAVFSIPILGGKPKRIINLDADNGTFTISPNGRQIAFFRGDSDANQTKLITVGLDETSEKEKILSSLPAAEFKADEFLAWSPDGRFLAIPRQTASETKNNATLFQVDIQSGENAQISDDGFEAIGKICYSRDGKFLYFVAKVDSFFQKIHRLDLATRRTERITNDGNTYSNYGMAISADGKILVADLTEIKSDLWSIGANGSENDARRVKSGETNGRRGLAVLADGSFVYTARIGDKYDIWISSSDGQNTQPLTNDAFEERALTASHDGRFIVFSSDRDGNRHLFRMNADGSDFKQLTFGEANDWQPDFSPDGNWIVYVSIEADKMLVKKITVEGGTPVSLTDYSAVNPTFSPDGSLIALKILSDSRTLPGTLAVIPATGGKPEKTFRVTDFEWFPTAIPIRWTADGTALIFRRERGGAGNLWQQNLNGSPPLQLTNFTTETIYNFVYSPDKTRIFLSRGLYQTSPVMIRNF